MRIRVEPKFKWPVGKYEWESIFLAAARWMVAVQCCSSTTACFVSALALACCCRAHAVVCQLSLTVERLIHGGRSRARWRASERAYGSYRPRRRVSSALAASSSLRRKPEALNCCRISTRSSEDSRPSAPDLSGAAANTWLRSTRACRAMAKVMRA